MAWKMLTEARKAAPILFAEAGPGCFKGTCPEGEYSCGRPLAKGTLPSDEELMVESSHAGH